MPKRILDGTKMNYHGFAGEFVCRKYENGRLAIMLVSKLDGHIANLTVNLPDDALEPGEMHIKVWSENEEFSGACLQTGMFEDTGKRVPTGFVEAQVWKLKEGVEVRNA